MVNPFVARFWALFFENWLPRLGLAATVTVLEIQGTYFDSAIPRVDIAAPMPGTSILVFAGVLIAGALIVSFSLPPSLMPLSYLLRAFSFIHATAVFYFAFFSPYFPHDLPGYLSTMLGSTMAFLSAIPAIMSFTFYIFDIVLVRKLLLTVLIIGHLIILAPLQYLVHCYVIVKWSALYMPVLYIMLGLLPQIAIFIAFYSWGMSWP
jgi:hypothetical protein